MPVVFTKTPSPILSNHNHLMVEEALKCAAEGQNRQQAFTGAPGVIPSVCQLPSSPSREIDLQT